MGKKNNLKPPKHSEHFLQKAAKLTVYPTDIYKKVVLVPKDEADTWDCAGARYLIKECDFTLEIVDEVEKKTVYNPKMQLDGYIKPKTISNYNIGDNYRMIEGFRQIELLVVTEKKLTFKYVGNVIKNDGSMKPEELDRAVKNKKAYKC